MIPRTSRVSLAALALAAGASHANASMFMDHFGTVTADNHYAIYARTPAGLALIGGNELGPAGNPGTYNWSFAESHALPADTTDLYVATWSDDNPHKGWIGQFVIADQTIYTGDPRWRVYSTGINLDDNAPYPIAADIDAHSLFATQHDLWETPYVGPTNLDAPAPWGEIAGIDDDARWMWRNVGPDPLRQGGDMGEYLIFHLGVVPAPGSAALLATAALTLARRRR